VHTRVSQGSHTHSHTHTYTHTHTCTHKHSHVWPVCCVIRDMWCVAWYVTCGVFCGFVVRDMSVAWYVTCGVLCGFVVRDMWCVAWYVTCGVICGFVDWNVEQGFQKKRGESKLAFDVEETFVKNM